MRTKAIKYPRWVTVLVLGLLIVTVGTYVCRDSSQGRKPNTPVHGVNVEFSPLERPTLCAVLGEEKIIPRLRQASVLLGFNMDTLRVKSRMDYYDCGISAKITQLLCEEGKWFVLQLEDGYLLRYVNTAEIMFPEGWTPSEVLTPEEARELLHKILGIFGIKEDDQPWRRWDRSIYVKPVLSFASVKVDRQESGIWCKPEAAQLTISRVDGSVRAFTYNMHTVPEDMHARLWWNYSVDRMRRADQRDYKEKYGGLVPEDGISQVVSFVAAPSGTTHARKDCAVSPRLLLTYECLSERHYKEVFIDAITGENVVPAYDIDILAYLPYLHFDPERSLDDNTDK